MSILASRSLSTPSTHCFIWLCMLRVRQFKSNRCMPGEDKIYRRDDSFKNWTSCLICISGYSWRYFFSFLMLFVFHNLFSPRIAASFLPFFEVFYLVGLVEVLLTFSFKPFHDCCIVFESFEPSMSDRIYLHTSSLICASAYDHIRHAYSSMVDTFCQATSWQFCNCNLKRSPGLCVTFYGRQH